MLMKQTIVLAATAVLLFILPIIYIIFWRKKTKALWKPLFFGAIGFVVSARVLELMVHYFFLILDSPVSRAIMGSTLLYVLYGIIGLFTGWRSVFDVEINVQKVVLAGILHSELF